MVSPSAQAFVCFSGWKAFETDKRRPEVNEIGMLYGKGFGVGIRSEINHSCDMSQII